MSDRAKTKCVDPDALVYGSMGAYGIPQKQQDFIHNAKMSVIRACYLGYIDPDSAVDQILSLQKAKPVTVEEGNAMANSLAEAFARIGEIQRHALSKAPTKDKAE